MVSTTNVTFTSDTEVDHHLTRRTNQRPEQQVRVEVGVPGHCVSLWFSDAADLTRLAAELTAAANCLAGLGCGEPA